MARGKFQRQPGELVSEVPSPNRSAGKEKEVSRGRQLQRTNAGCAGRTRTRVHTLPHVYSQTHAAPWRAQCSPGQGGGHLTHYPRTGPRALASLGSASHCLLLPSAQPPVQAWLPGHLPPTISPARPSSASSMGPAYLCNSFQKPPEQERDRRGPGIRCSGPDLMRTMLPQSPNTG